MKEEKADATLDIKGGEGGGGRGRGNLVDPNDCSNFYINKIVCFSEKSMHFIIIQ